MAKLRAVLFDLDGTLRDTRELIHDALDYAFRAHGLRSPSREELRPYIHHLSFVHDEFASGIDPEAFGASYSARTNELLPQVQLYADVERILSIVHDLYKVAVVTAGQSAPQYIERYGLTAYIDTIVGANDITKQKPDPEGIDVALKRLGVEPSGSVMIGDLATDIRAAEAANLATSIGITHGFGTAERLTQAGADYIIDSLAELPAILQQIDDKR
ncbi:MAG: HAD family hydrolase [Candidatus Saccharimonadales bacterium]